MIDEPRRGPLDVAVTGMGLVTPGGSTLGSFWDSACSGQSTAAPLAITTTRELPVRFGCAVRDFDAGAVLGDNVARRMDRACQLALVAGLAALGDASSGDVESTRAGVVVGTGIGGMSTHEAFIEAELSRGKSVRRNPLAIPMMMPNAAAAQLAIRLGWSGPIMTIATACASGANAIGEAARLIRAGAADVVLAGGTEAPLTAFSLIGFHHLRALSTRNDDPARASRPFDQQRDGFVLAEAAAFAVLESALHARARGAAVWGYLCGYGCNTDAFDIVSPREDGEVAADCMRLALEEADATPSDVLFVNAHGTSTILNDRAESRAINRLFGAIRPPVTSVKGAIGHSLGAAGAVEFVTTCLSLASGHIPPTANYACSEPGLDIEVVTGGGMPCRTDRGVVLSNSFAFGGNNVCLAVRRGERGMSALTGGPGND